MTFEEKWCGRNPWRCVTMVGGPKHVLGCLGLRVNDYRSGLWASSEGTDGNWSLSSLKHLLSSAQMWNPSDSPPVGQNWRGTVAERQKAFPGIYSQVLLPWFNPASKRAENKKNPIRLAGNLPRQQSTVEPGWQDSLIIRQVIPLLESQRKRNVPPSYRSQIIFLVSIILNI